MDPKTDDAKMEAEKKTDSSPDLQSVPRQKWSAILMSNWRLKGALILMLLIAGMYGWKNLSVRRLEKESAQQTAKITETTGKLLQEKDRALLRMTAITLSWVVRMEMPKGNYENIDQYFKQIIKEDKFKVILLAGTDGKIMVSTDRRMEGADLSQYFSNSFLDLYETSVSELNSEELIVAAPVIGLTAKLGVLVMVYPIQCANQPRKKS